MREYLKRSRQLSISFEDGACSLVLSCPITRIGSFRRSKIADFQLAISQQVLRECCGKRLVPRNGYGNADVLIVCCVPMRTLTSNGSMCRTTLCATVASKERKLAHIIQISLIMRERIFRRSCQLPVFGSGA